MVDTTLNRFVSSGTNAERVAFTPSPPTPASGPDPGYFFYETDTGNTYTWDGSAWDQVNTGSSLPALTDGKIWIGNGTNVAVARTLSGDVTTSNTGVTAVGANKIAVGQMHASATDVLFGRSTAAAGAGEEIVCTAAGRALIDDTTAANQRTTLGLGNISTINIDGNASNVLYGNGTFAAAPGGTTPAKVLITETVTSSSQGNVTFSSISSSYRDLEVRIRGRGDTSAADVDIYLQFNADTGNNYSSFRDIFFAGITDTNDTTNGAQLVLGRLPAATATANRAGGFFVTVSDYKGTTFSKPVYAFGSYQRASTSPSVFNPLAGGEWQSTSAITSIKIFPSAGNFVDNSVVSLYGHL